MKEQNVDSKTVHGFGEEWTKFNQENLEESEYTQLFNDYFSIFDWNRLPDNAIGFDMGSGSGRWAKNVAPKVSTLYCIDASIEALNVAKTNLQKFQNVRFINASVSDTKLEHSSMDFGYSLGVLHHVPDTQQAINDCVALLKKGAPFLIYLYYNFDNRPVWFKAIWKMSDFLRKIISRTPFRMRSLITDILAGIIYFPLARINLLLEKMGFSCTSIPLYYYRDKSFYTMRTDSLDRFGTILEQRFSKKQIEAMLIKAGLDNIQFSDKQPYWTAIGYKSNG